LEFVISSRGDKNYDSLPSSCGATNEGDFQNLQPFQALSERIINCSYFGNFFCNVIRKLYLPPKQCRCLKPADLWLRKTSSICTSTANGLKHSLLHRRLQKGSEISKKASSSSACGENLDADYYIL
jgi:hypothetical protein